MAETVLLVDDEPAIVKMLCIMLGAGGYEVVGAADATEAFRWLGLDAPEGTPPPVDAILMDVHLPHLDGLEACRRIKADPRLADIPILIITAASVGTSALDQAFAAGAADFLPKPINRVELLARVRSAVNLKRERDRRKAREAELEEAKRALEDANERLELLATLDPLTGVANRRQLDRGIDAMWRRATRTGSPLSVLMVDIDHFKAFNDAVGHQGGDDCLRRVAGALSASARRAGDLVARYGGEEFAILLNATDGAGAQVLGEQVRKAVEALGIAHPGGGSLTVSVGVASAVAGSDGAPEGLLQAADRALYEAKRAGRNRVVVAPPR
jgi:diguanylate cyclase (GGDEF)-like protein